MISLKIGINPLLKKGGRREAEDGARKSFKKNILAIHHYMKCS
jgi:hypothetical protein